jgi:hypothetical protein
MYRGVLVKGAKRNNNEGAFIMLVFANYKMIMRMIALAVIAVGALHLSPGFTGWDDKTKPKGTLYDKAKAAKKGRNNNHVIIAFRDEIGTINVDLRQLTMRSTNILVGRVLSNKSYLNDARDDIYTVHKVMVQSVLKGDLDNGNVIDIQVIGGGWRYSDGTWVSKRSTNMLPIGNGSSYVFFLNLKDPSLRSYVPSSRVQSIYNLEFDTGTIMPNSRYKLDPLVTKYKNISIDSFLAEIRPLVRQAFGR